MWHSICRFVIKRAAAGLLADELRRRDFFVCDRKYAEELFEMGALGTHIFMSGEKWDVVRLGRRQGKSVELNRLTPLPITRKPEDV